MPTTVPEQNDALLEYGMTLSYVDVPASGQSVGAYTLLAGIREWGNLPSLEGSKTESTNIDGSSKVKQYTPVDSEPGTVECTLAWKMKAGATAGKGPALLIPLHMVKKVIKITFADGSTHEQVGFIDKVAPTKRGEKEVSVAIRIQLSDAPVFTAGT